MRRGRYRRLAVHRRVDRAGRVPARHRLLGGESARAVHDLRALRHEPRLHLGTGRHPLLRPRAVLRNRRLRDGPGHARAPARARRQSGSRSGARHRAGRGRRQPARTAAVPRQGPVGRILRHRHSVHGLHRGDRGPALALRRRLQRTHRSAAAGRCAVALGRERVARSRRELLRRLRHRPRRLPGAARQSSARPSARCSAPSATTSTAPASSATT